MKLSERSRGSKEDGYDEYVSIFLRRELRSDLDCGLLAEGREWVRRMFGSRCAGDQVIV